MVLREVPITIGHACNPGNGIKIPGGSDTTSPVEVGNGTNPVKIGGGGDSGGTGITVPKNGSGDPIRLGSPIRFTDGTTQSTAAKTYSQSAETATGGAFLRLKGTATGAADTNDDVKLAAGSNVTITRTDADTITIASSYTDTNTTYSHSVETTSGGAMIRLTGSDSTNDDVKLIAGSNVTITRTDADTVTISAAGPVVDTLYDAGYGSGTLSFNRNNGTIQKFALYGNATSLAITNMTAAQSFTLILTQGTAGSTLTTSGSFKFASGYKTLSTAAGAIDMLNIFYDGTTYYCTLTTGYA